MGLPKVKPGAALEEPVAEAPPEAVAEATPPVVSPSEAESPAVWEPSPSRPGPVPAPAVMYCELLAVYSFQGEKKGGELPSQQRRG